MKNQLHATKAKKPNSRLLTFSLITFTFCISLLSSSIVYATQNHTHRYIEIEIGDGADSKLNHTRERRYQKYDHQAHHHYSAPLRDRLRRLESAVRELQREVWDLRRENDYFKSQQHRYACYIQTPFDGTFLGRGSTRIEATAIALNQCEAKAQSWCKEQRVKCEKA